MGGGSGGGGGTTTSQFAPPNYALQGFEDYVNNASAITQNAYQPYMGETVAPINNTQVQGMQLAANVAGNNAPDYSTARAMNQLTAAGAYQDPTATVQTQVPGNPYVGGTAGDPNSAFGQMMAQNQGNAYMGFNPSYELMMQNQAQNQFDNPNSTAYQQSVGPQAQNAYMGFNPAYELMMANTQVNPYIGSSPAFDALKQQGMGDITAAYQRGTAAQTDSAFNHAGAFSGGGRDAQIQANQYGLGQSLSNYNNQMDQGQWQNSANLQQQATQAFNAQNYGQYALSSNQAQQLAMAQNQNAYTHANQADQNAQQMAMATNAQNFGQYNQSSNQAQQFAQAYNAANQGQYTNSMNADQQLGQLSVNAQQGDLNRQSAAWNNERQRQVGSLPLAMQAGQYDLGMANALTGVGDAQRSYQQDMLNSQQNSYNQYLQYPFQMLDAYGSALSRASGNYGSNTAQSQQNYTANPLASLFGAGLLGAGAYNSFGSP